MSTTTTRLGLYKPAADGSELVSVVTDINNNMDSVDAKTGAFACTSGTRPGSPYNGQFIRETDTGKMYVCSNTVGPVWSQVMFGNSVAYGDATDTALNIVGGVTATKQFSVTRALAVDHFLRSNVTADTQQRLLITADGKMLWGSGAIAGDTNLYRVGTDTLKTDDAFQVGGALTVAGAATLADATLSGNFNLGSARYRNQLSSATTVANTTTETAIASMTIPANDVAIGATYRIKAWGTAAVTGTPAISFRGKASAVAMLTLPSITVRSGATDGQWEAEFAFAVTATGAGGAASPSLRLQNNFLTSATTWTPFGPITAAPVSRDFSLSTDMQITVQWGTASPSNTITCRGFIAERVS